jgi:ribonuclease G
MDEELLINVDGFETRVALLQNHSLAEIHLQRSGRYSLTGNVYKGKVVRILPGMQAAFVEIGLERPGFLHVRGIQLPQFDAEGAEVPPADIRTLIHDGQELLVQVAKDPISGKGARLTTHLALASRYLVLMPFNAHVGVSQRIEDEAERERLRTLVEALRAEHGMDERGFILRTAADGMHAEALAADVCVLKRVWDWVKTRIDEQATPGLVYEELPIDTRILRDLASADLRAVRIDDAETFQRVKAFVDQFLPEYAGLISHYEEPVPLFERFGVEDELQRALDRRVPLKSGGHLVIEQTEAMTTIDVNTGGFVGARNLEDTVFRTNLEAASVIPRQLRLRNLGGIIVIDFIDMAEEEHRRAVMRALEKACEADSARIRLADFSHLGLVEISRKRTRESLSQQVCQPCPTCVGSGMVKTAETVCFEVFRAILREHHQHQRCKLRPALGEYLIRAAESVVDRLLVEEAQNVAGLARQVQCPIRFEVEPSYGPDQFDLVRLPHVPHSS